MPESQNSSLSGLRVLQHPPDLPWQWEDGDCAWPRLETLRQIRVIRNLRLGLRCNVSSSEENFEFRPVIFCDLVVVDHDDPDSPYQALSYSWGPAFPESHRSRTDEAGSTDNSDVDDLYVLCNGGKIPITKNLSLALLQLLKYEEDTSFWVDMISINQSDLSEKNAQVASMDRVYEHAELILIWLGPADETSDLAVDLMTDIKKYYDDTDISKRIEGPLPFNDPTVWQSLKMPPFGAREWTAIGRFFSRTWHRRIWMVQEIVLAKAAAVMCGDRTFSWSIVWHFSKWLSGIGWEKELELNASGLLSADVDIRGLNSLRQLFDLALAREVGFTSSPLNFVRRRLLGPQITDDNLASHLGVMLLHTRGRWATNDRDQVYALLGLIRKITSSSEAPPFTLRPDYGKSVADVYIETARAVIDGTDSLGFLALADRIPSDSPVSLPSWVPDLSNRSSAPVAVPPEAYDAAANFPDTGNDIERFPNKSDSLLHTEGLMLDTVTGKTDAFIEVLSPAQKFDIGCILDFVCASYPSNPPQAATPVDLLFDLLTQGSLTKHWAQWPTSRDMSKSLAALQVPRETALIHFQWWILFHIANYSWSNRFAMPALRLERPATAELLGRSSLWSDLTTVIPSYYARYLSIMRKDETSSNAQWDRSEFDRELMTPMRTFEQLCEAVRLRCLLRTRDKGLLSTGPPQAKSGDEIWVLRGGNVPFLLRPVGDGHWRLVGVVYLPGFMHGIPCDNDSLSVDKVRSVVLE